MANDLLERARVSLDAYDEQPRQEYVKCVVVGDTAVGKTRLICSYVYDQPGLSIPSVSQRAHIPTVFAIDQYVADPNIRKRAKLFLHGVQAQLRIWDTFGDHEKNRKFAYQNAHVVVLCFSIGMRSSLRNVNANWYPEIKKYCPRAPIILVGTQLDRRHTDPCAFKNLSNITTLTDILNNNMGTKKRSSKLPQSDKCTPPEDGRQLAREINAAVYMEASVVTKHGVNEVFENAVRVALINRRQSKPLFSSHLKRVKNPSPQKPYLPTRPDPTRIVIPVKNDSIETIPNEIDTFCDVTFLVDHELIYAHSVVLISGSHVFSRLLNHPDVLNVLGYTNFIPETEEERVKSTKGFINGVLVDGVPFGFETIDVLSDPQETCKVFVKVKNVSAQDFKSIIEFIYTGKICLAKDPINLLQVCNNLSLDQTCSYLKNILNGENFLNFEVQSDLQRRKIRRYIKYFFKKQLYADCAFIVDGIAIPAHKYILVSHCSIMEGMFRKGSFKESLSHKKVDFHDTSYDSFIAVLEYLYTGTCEKYNDLHGTLQLANFLCLPRLVALCESEIVNYIKEITDRNSREACAAALASYKLAQFHNAPQLSAWCLHFMATNYNALCKEQSQEMKSLDTETLQYLEKNRWPPVWYLKEQDYYERTMAQLEREKNLKKKKKQRRKYSGCF